jgi:tetraacyldisaccharide-1-P 4'-kinase
MKRWWQSRTLWFNAIVSGLVALEATFSALQTLLPTNIYAIAVTVLAVGNAILRIITTQGISK